MGKARQIELTARELKVTHDVMVTISAYTYDECREHFGWTRADLDAWSSAQGKLDHARSGR